MTPSHSAARRSSLRWNVTPVVAIRAHARTGRPGYSLNPTPSKAPPTPLPSPWRLCELTTFSCLTRYPPADILSRFHAFQMLRNTYSRHTQDRIQIKLNQRRNSIRTEQLGHALILNKWSIRIFDFIVLLLILQE